MENKINVAKLLKDCPKGMEFDCLLCNSPIALECVDYASDYPIRAIGKDGFHHVFTKYGTSYNHDDAKCVILPKGKTSWEGFVPPCKFKVGDKIRKISVIKWHTGEINDAGYYLATDRDGRVYVLWYRKGSVLSDSLENIIAWCPLSGIEPYKE